MRQLVKLTSLRESRDNLRTRTRLDIKLKGSIGIGRGDQITELFARFEFVFSQPRVEKLLLVLREDELGKFNRLDLVEFAALQTGAKVLQQRRALSRLRRHAAESSNGLIVTQRVHRRRELCGSLVVARIEEHVKLRHHENIRTRKVASRRERDREFQVVKLSADIRNHGSFVKSHQQDLPASVDNVKATSVRCLCADKHGFLRNTAAVHWRSRFKIVHKQ